MTNLWRDVPRGEKFPQELNAIIEIPKGSPNKYEIDKKTGLIALDRANYTASPYPFDYGFVPQTLWPDNDALDVIVLTTYPLHVGILIRVRPVGVIEMIDGGESDWKVIVVPVNDKRWDDVHNITDLNKHSLQEYAHFFETYKDLKTGKRGETEIRGFGDKQKAIEALIQGASLYDESLIESV